MSWLLKVNARDLLIYAGGEEPYTEFVGSITDLSLCASQRSALGFISQARPPLALVLIEGRTRLLHEAAEQADAVIFAGLPGFEGAEALANIISGAVNPSGKLPVSYPMHPNHFLPYHHKPSQLYVFNPEKANEII